MNDQCLLWFRPSSGDSFSGARAPSSTQVFRTVICSGVSGGFRKGMRGFPSRSASIAISSLWALFPGTTTGPVMLPLRIDAPVSSRSPDI